MNATSLPAPEKVAARATEILSAILADPEFDAFATASLKYDEDWACFAGAPVISKYDQESDKTPLLSEGLRALSLKAAVFEMTRDEKASEIPIAIPVDEMTHAMIAQPRLLARITERVGVQIIHQTDQEHTDYRTGDYTHRAYALAWGEPSDRYWIDHEEAQRRLGILRQKYEAAGFLNMGQAHVIDFAELVAV
ncbi:hypothetical protein MOV08_27830 [Streptomyces yunnanensis]|uniref:Uncharacterized protein n=1 Tax=Streptomyces yunnanensis TaxID=156453 RepID=A0ABY8ACJ3_9ACTN|nr:hypothetical protein [Streptomyces yunnanensis]WEB42683.1 hypothetical protein MOV08_27830 [Streptomyces yunnanensis]